MYTQGMHTGKNILKRLECALKGNILAHAYLFTGERGSGKRETAWAFARTLLGCDDAHLEIHPDFFMLSRLSEDDAEKEISIDEVRGLKQRLSLTSAMGGWKIAVVERVELLAKEAANALLKVLEEPQGQTLILMTTERYGAVLPTICSRAVRTAFPPVHSGSAEKIPADLANELNTFFSQVTEMSYGLRFKASESYAKNVKTREVFMRYAAEMLRKLLWSGSTANNKLISQAKSFLRTDALLTHTNASPRLLLDVLLMQF